MAKQNKRKQAQAARAKSEPTRRDVLGLARKGLIGLAGLGFAGYFANRLVQNALFERDLSRLFAGLPSIVQVHDPSCATCNALQKEVRSALKCFEDTPLQYLIADIKTDEGAAFAAGQGASHVTLLLFAADGTRTGIVQGMRSDEELKPIFEAHLRA